MIENRKGLIYNILVMKKSILITLTTIFIGAVLLTGCGLSKDDEQTNILVSDSFGITERIREPFEGNYYNIDELKQTVNEEVAAFNTSTGSGVEASKVQLSDKANVTDLEIKYDNSSEFSLFNNVVFFIGSPIEAQAQGFDLKVILTDVNDPSKTITTVDIMAMSDYKIVIFDYKNNIFLPEEIEYKSDNCQLLEPNKVVKNADDSAMAYVMFK